MTEVTMNDLISQETKRDPHTFFAHLRSTEPIFYVEEMNTWVLTTYEDALLLLKDPRFTKDNRKVAQSDNLAQEVDGGLRTLLQVDPPDHTRLRSLVSKAFTPRMIEQLRPRIQQIASELLDDVEKRGSMDLIIDFAYPLPITVITEMLGIPATDRQKFRIWTQALVNMQEENWEDSREAFFSYIRALLNEKRVHPGDDLTSRLVQVKENEDQLNEIELVSMIFLLIVAGHETTVNLLGNGTLTLLQHPDQLQLLRDDPSLIVAAVEELLRYTAPVSLSDERWANEDIELHGKQIRKGQMVVASLVSANADPHQFHNGDAFDITRRENQHLAFGKGIHFCLGAPLARLEAQIAFPTLLQRLPNLRLASEAEHLTWTHNPMLRGLKSLPVTF
jgi:cytochrome P450 PksS